MAEAKEPQPTSGKAREAGASRAQIKHEPDKPSPHQNQNLNFKVSAEFKKRFKRYALDHDLTMIQLLAEGFELVEQKRGKLGGIS
jgi:hypothetical protein